mmetsp:Transcript_40280/g.51909  ORF Transcript_40280/g.51909 Transcript_40280/m.51909 type:complete len:121 (-) Transcript_40280:1860-2222(-)
MQKTCEFAKTKITYLGHQISKDGIAPDPQKVQAIKNLPLSVSLKQLRSFIGLINYYQCFIKEFQIKMTPLIELTKMKCKQVDWTVENIEHFQKLKDELSQSCLLSFSRFRRNVLFVYRCK